MEYVFFDRITDYFARTQYNPTHKPHKYPRLEMLPEPYADLGTELENAFRQMTAVEGAVFLGELVGAWILSVPESTILDYLRNPENRSYVAQAERMAKMAVQSELAEEDLVFFLERLLFASWEEFWGESL